MPSPISFSQRVVAYPSPNTADSLFYETVSIAQGNPIGASTAYGTAHSETTRFPNHKLCLIEPIEDDQNHQRWWYVNDRTSQEAYNYEISYPYGGEKNYPRYTRTYIVPRATAALTLGDLDPTYTDAKLVFQSQKNIEGQIGSLYVAQTRVYDILPGSDDATPGSGDGQKDNGYTVERPLGSKTFLRVTWKLTLPRTVADGNLQTSLTATCPIAGYTNLKLTSETIQASEENNQLSTVTRVYEGNASGAAFPSTAEIFALKKEYPGILPPDKFVTWIEWKERTVQTDTPSGVSLSATATTDYTITLVKVDPQSTDRGSKTVIEGKFNLQTINGQNWDKNLMKYVPFTIQAVAKATADALTASAGTEISVQPYSGYWSIVTTETPPTSTLLGGGGAAEWYSSDNYYWPPVLLSIAFGNVGKRPAPGIAAASNEAYYEYTMKPEWNGPTKCKHQVAFYTSNPIAAYTDIPEEKMVPRAISFNWPGVARLSIPECLHGTTSFSGTTGSNNPNYANVAYGSLSFPATTFTDWPTSIIGSYKVAPYKGGYLVHQITFYKPE